MYKLSVDIDVCKGVDCLKCEEKLPKFRTHHKGFLLVSDRNIDDPVVIAAITDVIKVCPVGAITWVPYV